MYFQCFCGMRAATPHNWLMNLVVRNHLRISHKEDTINPLDKFQPKGEKHAGKKESSERQRGKGNR